MSSQLHCRTVVVGGVAAGMSAATRLRRNDETREIVVLERGDHVSFANCGLPYHVGGVIPERDDLLLQTPESLGARFGIDVRAGHEVTAIDPAAKRVDVRDRAGRVSTLRYDDLILATGAAPVRLPIPGIERAHVLRDVADLDAIMAALNAPAPARTAVILGAGFIGLELAENLVGRGLQVAVVEVADQVLAPLDPEMAVQVAEALQDNGVTVRTGARATGIDPLAVVLHDGSVLPADLVVTAVGVRPESQLARQAGLHLGEGDGILVDDHQRTSDPSIYAVGDVAVKRDAVGSGPVLVPLAGPANRHGRLVADVITGRPVTAQPVLGTAVVGVFGVTAAVTGWSEKRLRAAGRSIRVIHSHPTDHAGYYPGAQGMALKLLVDADSDRILGAQGVGGAGVDKRIDVIATAMRAGLRASDLADLELCYAPQYGSAKDPVVMLGMIADNLASGVTRTVQWHEVEQTLDDGATLLDVRSRAEHDAGAIPKSVNVPVDELRAEAPDLPAGPLVVYCEVGQRGHIASRLLTGLGREVCNLDGGYRTWLAATS